MSAEGRRVPPPPPPGLRARVLAAAAKEPAPTRRTTLGLRAVLAAAAFPTAAVLVIALGGVRLGGRDVAWVDRLAVAWVAVAVAATVALGVVRARGRVEASSRTLAALAGATVVATFAVLGASGVGVEAQVAPLGAHVVCAVLGAGIALVPALFLGAPHVARRLGSGRPLGAALGAAAGVLGAVGIHLHCPRPGLVHALVAHASVVLVVAGLGLAAGRLLELRAREP